MFRHIRLANKIFQKFQKLKNYPLRPLKKQKSKNECSSELMLNTKNVQTHYISKQNFSKILKAQKLPLKTPKNQKSKKKCSSELMLKTKNVQTH